MSVRHLGLPLETHTQPHAKGQVEQLRLQEVWIQLPQSALPELVRKPNLIARVSIPHDRKGLCALVWPRSNDRTLNETSRFSLVNLHAAEQVRESCIAADRVPRRLVFIKGSDRSCG